MLDPSLNLKLQRLEYDGDNVLKDDTEDKADGEEEEEEEDVSDDDSANHKQAALSGQYDPEEFRQLPVSTEVSNTNKV